MNKFRKNIVYPFSILVIGLFFGLFAEWIYENRFIETNPENRISRFQKTFNENKDRATDKLNWFIEHFENTEKDVYTDLDIIKKLENKYEKYGFIFLVKKEEEPFFWSNNSIGHYDISLENNSGLVELENGWYYCLKKTRNDLDFKILLLLKRNYNYQNHFLKNTYHDYYDMMPDTFYPSNKNTDFKIKCDKNNKILFFISLDDEFKCFYESKLIHYISISLSILAIIFIFYGLYHIVFCYNYFKNNFFIAILVLLFLFSLTRALLFNYSFFISPLIETELFSPSLYATSYYLPSLGDLFFNVLLILCFSLIINHKAQYGGFSIINSNWKKMSIGVLCMGLIIYAGYLTYITIEGLVINSRLNLNVNFVLNFDYYSIIGFLIIGCMLFAYYFFTRTIFGFLKVLINQIFTIYVIATCTLVIVLMISLITDFNLPFLLWLFIALVSFLILAEKTKENQPLLFGNLLIYVFVFSIFSTVALYNFNLSKEREERKTFALKLASDHDPIAEYLFLEKQKDLLKDTTIQDILINDLYNNELHNYLRINYFHDYWQKYDMQVTVCHPDDILLIRPTNIKIECKKYFNDYIYDFGKTTISDYLFYLDNNTGRDSYIAQIPFFFKSSLLDKYPQIEPDYYLFIEFDSKNIFRDIGFPELLVDESVDMSREIVDYSFAFYKFDELTHRAGKYFFNNKSSTYGQFDRGFAFFETDNYTHLNYQKDKNTQIIVSREKEGIFEIIAPFSYLCLLFFLMIIVFWMLLNYSNNNFKIRLNFKRRVQFSMIFIVILSVITIGWASVWFLLNIHNNKNLDIISEKAHSILVELEHEFGNEPYLDYQYDYYLSDQLLKLSNVFFTDINVFDPKGKLLSSSRTRIYDEGLVSILMNPVAFNKMRDQNKSFYVHKEEIGKLNYLSAYIPLINNDNQLLAYINLPYFAKEREFRYELSTFLITFINIYFLLVVISIVLAFFVSNYITLPLQLIRENLSRIRIGKANRKINWYRNDEIGNLVGEYNRMIDELETSAELLAKNERESAWREMAKQVAHEIKNPLTPMKLSVQYLHKAWNDRVEDWDKRLEGFTKTMIEQIDSLSLIAGEFSDFAKLPESSYSKINLKTFISELTKLYKDFDNVKIHLDIPDEDLFVYADSKKLLRVFNNLIKNAIQAYSEDKIAYINLRCHQKNNYVIIKLEDYGCGIPDNQKCNIFKPYFTTKTGGVGLGLAMVKNIIEAFEGDITFESNENKGSVFIIKLPLID